MTVCHLSKPSQIAPKESQKTAMWTAAGTATRTAGGASYSRRRRRRHRRCRRSRRSLSQTARRVRRRSVGCSRVHGRRACPRRRRQCRGQILPLTATAACLPRARLPPRTRRRARVQRASSRCHTLRRHRQRRPPTTTTPSSLPVRLARLRRLPPPRIRTLNNIIHHITINSWL